MKANYAESLKIGWLIFWRSFPTFIFLGTLINLLFVPADYGIVGLVSAALLTIFWIMPLVVEALLSKRFNGFRLELIRESAQ